MTMQPPVEATTHLVGHLLRELESALRAVVRVVAEYTEQPRLRGEPDKHKRDILAILKGWASQRPMRLRTPGSG